MSETNLDNWIGRSQSVPDRMDLSRATAMQATLNHTQPSLIEGSILPPLWHWLYFWDQVQHEELARDGHAKRGGFLPPVELPRRMWAAGDVEFLSPLALGARAERQSHIASIEQKNGKTGELVFVTVIHEIIGNGECHLREKQTIVYREAAAGDQSSPSRSTSTAAGMIAPAADFSQVITPDSLMLFRYSALTFNAHRIHYDRGYVMDEEDYPGLLVHGPLMATLLADLATTQYPELSLSNFTFRATKPVFDLAPFNICGKHIDSEGKIELFVADSDNEICMKATAKMDS